MTPVSAPQNFLPWRISTTITTQLPLCPRVPETISGCQMGQEAFRTAPLFPRAFLGSSFGILEPLKHAHI